MTDDVQAAEDAAKATAALYNAGNPTGPNEAENDARAAAAAADLAKLAGNTDHDGNPAVREDTAEETAAVAQKAEEAKAAEEKAAEDKAAAEAKEAYDKLTPEEQTAHDEKVAADEKAAKEKADEAAAAEHADVTEWAEVDSPEYNAAVSLMKAAGMKPAEASVLFSEAVATGDISKVDMAKLNEAVGEDKAALIMAGFGKYVEGAGQALLQKTKEVHDAVGGTANWQSMVRWARTATANNPELKKQIENIEGALGNENAFVSNAAAQEFKALYNADAKNSTIVADPKPEVKVEGARQSPAAPTATPLTARMYSEAVETASRTMNGAALNAEVTKLRAGRAAGRAAGL